MPAENKGYTPQRRYNDTKRENLNIGLPKGTKDKWKAIAASKGMSLTEYITKLIDEDNK